MKKVLAILLISLFAAGGVFAGSKQLPSKDIAQKPDDGKLEDTTYDVGPAIARAWVGLGSDARSRVVRVFESAAVTAGVDGATAQQLYESIRTQLNEIGGVEYTPYLQAMQKSFTDKKVRTLREMSGAFAEIAAWVGGTN